jgi:hypothetical protein
MCSKHVHENRATLQQATGAPWERVSGKPVGMGTALHSYAVELGRSL